MSEPLICLIGIGNRSLGDDGIGLAIIEIIKDQLSEAFDVRLWEDMDALSIAAELLEIRTAVVIVDCADMQLEGGDFRWFKQSECCLGHHLNCVSTHGFGFADALLLAQTLGFKQTLCFFTIQPVQLDLNNQLSEALNCKKAVIAEALVQNLHHFKEHLTKH